MGAGDLSGDGQTEAGPSTVSGPALIEPDKALEDPFTLVQRNAGTVVGYLDGGHGRISEQPKLYTFSGVTSCVVGKVAKGTREVMPVSGDPQRWCGDDDLLHTEAS